MSASLNRGLFSWRNMISRKQIQTLLFKKLESRCSSGYLGAKTPPTNSQVQGKQLQQTTIRNTSIQSSTAQIVSPDYIVRSPHEDREIPDVSFIEFMFSKMNGHAQESTAMINGITGQTYTFSELKESVIKVASALTKQGYKKGDVFCLFSPNLPEFSISFLAVSAIGGIVTTANPLYSEQELSRQLTHSTSVAIFTIPQMVDVVKKASADHPNIKEIIVFGEADGCRPFSTLTSDDGKAFPDNVDIDSARDILVLPYSSGTTGLPKGVMVSHRNVIANLIQTATSLPIYPSDCMLAVLPFFHIYGMVVIQFGAFYSGTPLTTLPKFDQTDFLKTIETYKVTLAPIVPPIAIFLSKHDLVSEYDLTSVRLWMCAAAPLGKTSQMEMAERLKTNNIIQGYGLTETSPVTHIDQVPPTLGTIGTCLCNTECKVIDLETGDLLGPGEEGEMCIRGPQVMMGYLNNPEATAGTIKDGWLHTGDICHYDENGYFTVADRLKELIKYKGFQVPPAELEALLLSHPHVDDAAVIGVPDDMAGELPKAFVTIHPHTTVTPEEIAQFVEEHVSPHKKLRGGVEIIEKIPKSASGKILRRELRDRSS